MGRWIPAGLAVVALAASAQGVYQPVPRSNDPFVFCTEGAYRLPAEAIRHCWQPVDPRSGTWVYTCWDYCNASGCPPVNTVTLGQYALLCPVGGGRDIDWTGRVPANMTPFWH
ncbi:MAG TPA: hypothetical protein VLK29_12715 [Luteimonas sp.]|nr:hypothetical protein [Luteimonas sp.]